MKKNTRILTLVFVVAFLTLLVGCLPTPTPPNEAPIITSTPVTTATIGVLYTYDVNATDPDGDALTYSLTAYPTGMTINSKTGVISWRPISAQIGDNSVTVKVSDKSSSIIQSFTIKVKTVNHTPAIISIPITTATVGITYVYDVNATDPDNDVLTYTLDVKPGDMTINYDTGLIMWTPVASQIGNNPVTVKVFDGDLDITQSFTIVVSEESPGYTPPPTPSAQLAYIVVEPKTMTLFVGESETIKSVTATYEIKGFEVPIPLGYCTYESDDTDVATVSAIGVVTAIGVGTDTITVKYKGKADEITVTVGELVSKTITIRWFEDAIRYNADGTFHSKWYDDPIPPLVDPEDETPRPPATLIQDDGGYHFADIFDYFNIHVLPDTKGSVVINGTGQLSGWATYTLYGLSTENDFVGQVNIVIYDEPIIVVGYSVDGTMEGTYTQWKYAYGTEAKVKYGEGIEGFKGYTQAVRCEGFEDKWFVQYTDYIAYEWE